MHFSIPDTQEFLDGAGNAYVVSDIYTSRCLLLHLFYVHALSCVTARTDLTVLSTVFSLRLQGYDIHVNGLFHCTVRYKQLHNLHVQLSRELDISLPIFPPKKFFPLTGNQQEERRLALEKYIQSIAQNVTVTTSQILNGFLLSAQQESIGGPSVNEILDVFLMDGTKVSLCVSTTEHSGEVLKVCGRYRDGTDTVSVCKEMSVFRYVTSCYSIIRFPLFFAPPCRNSINTYR